MAKDYVDAAVVKREWCPMANLSKQCVSDCAWYAGTGCAIILLVTQHCANLYKLQKEENA